MRSGDVSSVLGIAALLLAAPLVRAASGPPAEAWQLDVLAAERLSRDGRFAEAEAQLAAAQKDCRDCGPRDRRLAVILNNLGGVYEEEGRCLDARRAYERAIGILAGAVENLDRESAVRVAGNLVTLYAECGASAAELRRLAGFLERQLARMPADAPEVGQLTGGLAGIRYRQHRYRDAEALFRRAYEIARAAGPDGQVSAVLYLNDLALLTLREHRPAEALDYARRCQELLEQTVPRTQPARARALGNLAVVHTVAKDFTGAEALFREALDLVTVLPTPNASLSLYILENYGAFLKHVGRREEAAGMAARARALRAAAAPATRDATVDAASLAFFAR